MTSRFSLLIYVLWSLLLLAGPGHSQNDSDPTVAKSTVENASEPLFILEGPEGAAPESKTKPIKKSDGKTLPEIDEAGKGIVQMFRLGNEAYEADDMETAAAWYEAIVRRGAASGDLYFNLGNAYFRMGNFGKAVLNYERARKLRPRDLDIRHNLAHARTFLIDKEMETEKLPGSLETLLILHFQTTTNETLWLLVVLSFVFVCLLICNRLRLKITQNVYYSYLRGLLFILVVLQLLSASYKVFWEDQQRYGVILEDAVKATAAPASGDSLFEVNSGTKVEILAVRNGFAHIRLKNGIPAFIPEQVIEEI